MAAVRSGRNSSIRKSEFRNSSIGSRTCVFSAAGGLESVFAVCLLRFLEQTVRLNRLVTPSQGLCDTGACFLRLLRAFIGDVKRVTFVVTILLFGGYSVLTYVRIYLTVAGLVSHFNWLTGSCESVCSFCASTSSRDFIKSPQPSNGEPAGRSSVLALRPCACSVGEDCSLGNQMSSDAEVDEDEDVPSDDLTWFSPASGTASTSASPTVSLTSQSSISALAVDPASASSNHETNSSNLRSSIMIDCTVPDNLTVDELKTLQGKAIAELNRVRGVVGQATTTDEKIDLGNYERRLEWMTGIIESRLNRAEVSSIAGTVSEHSAAISNLRSDVATLASGQVVAERERGDLGDRLTFVETFSFQLRDQIDQLANEHKRRNVVIYGRPVTDDVDGLVDDIFSTQPGLLELVDDAFFVGADRTKKLPLKVIFTTITAARNCLKWGKSPEFHRVHGDLSIGRDVTTLRKVGTSRLSAAADALRRQFEGIIITPS